MVDVKKRGRPPTKTAFALEPAPKVGSSITDPQEALELLQTFRKNPAWFCQKVLGYDPWSMQIDILDALAKPRTRVAVRAAHAVGKTNLAAMAVFWRVMTGGIVISTAPTWTQVKSLLWKEIHTTYNRYKDILGGEMFQTEWRVSPNCYAMGLSTNEGVRFQGIHGDVLVILDEAPGVRPGIWEAIEGIRAGGDVTILALGNPTSVGNPFSAAFATAGQDTGWDLFSIPAFVTPNFKNFPTIESLLEADIKDLDDIPRPYLITPRWVLEKYREWGPDSPMYQSRVMANFPNQSEFALFPLSWIMAAAYRELPTPEEMDFVAGVDVAGPGEDETVVVIRHGPMILDFQAWTKPDPRQEVIEYLGGWREKAVGRGSLKVNVDAIAIGHYFALDIKNAGFTMNPVNVGLPPMDTALKSNLFLPKGKQPINPGELRFANLKAQIYWNLRTAFQQGTIGGVTNTIMQNQLETLRYEETDHGKIKIESKEEARARGVKSPDRAEALMLSFAFDTKTIGTYAPVIMVDSTGGWGINSNAGRDHSVLGVV